MSGVGSMASPGMSPMAGLPPYNRSATAHHAAAHQAAAHAAGGGSRGGSPHGTIPHGASHHHHQNSESECLPFALDAEGPSVTSSAVASNPACCTASGSGHTTAAQQQQPPLLSTPPDDTLSASIFGLLAEETVGGQVGEAACVGIGGVEHDDGDALRGAPHPIPGGEQERGGPGGDGMLTMMLAAAGGEGSEGEDEDEDNPDAAVCVFMRHVQEASELAPFPTAGGGGGQPGAGDESGGLRRIGLQQALARVAGIKAQLAAQQAAPAPSPVAATADQQQEQTVVA